MYGVVVVVCAGGASSMIVLMIMFEYATRVVTLCACVIILCWSGCDYFQCDREIRFMCNVVMVGVIIFNAIERYVSCVMLGNVE